MGIRSPTLKIDFNVNDLGRFFPFLLIMIIRCLLGVNTELEVIAFYMAEAILVPLLIVLAANSLRQGSVILGLICMPIGFGMYFGSIYLGLSLPPAVLLEYPVQASIVVLLIVGSSMILFSTVALALWIAKIVIANHRVQSRIVGLIIAFAVIVLWFREASIFLTNLGVYPMGLPSTELYYYMFLILAGVIFIPRRQGVTVFYFLLGVVLAVWGLQIVSGGMGFNSIVGHSMRVLGTMLAVLFSGSLGSEVLYLQHHPENKILVALPLWYFAEALTSSVIQFPLSAPRVFLIGLALYVIVKEVTFKDDILSSIISSVCMVAGAIAASFAALQLSLYWEYVFFGGTPPLLDPISSIILSAVSLMFCIYGIVTFGAFLRKKLATSPTNRRVLSITGGLMAIAGFILAESSMVVFLFPLYYTDTLFILLVGLGAMLVSMESGRISGAAASLGFAMAVSVAFRSYFYTLVFTFYPAMLAMIFFGIQHYRTDKKPKSQIRLPVTRRVAPPTPPEIIASDEPAPSFAPPHQVRPSAMPIQRPDPIKEKDEERMATNWYNRAVTFHEEGIIEEAIRSVETALKWVPDHQEALALWKELQDERKRRQFQNENL